MHTECLPNEQGTCKPENVIICASPFFDEADLLEIRCREMAGLVDAHVIVEADLTYTGKSKPWTFDQARFAPWPIIYYRINLPPSLMRAWDREDIHRKFVFQVVKSLRPEIVFYLDIDEIPRISTLGRFNTSGQPIMHLGMDDLRYRADRVARMPWTNPYVARHDPEATREPGRYDTRWPVLPDSGWHLCWMGGQQQVLKSAQAISHAEEECGIEFARRVAAGDKPEFDQLTTYPLEQLPDCVKAEPGRWPILFQ
jgi:beta-1,4-mannosyl-glycoprotein beta-1,4-N-acetylglucosaminyltransferase